MARDLPGAVAALGDAAVALLWARAADLALSADQIASIRPAGPVVPGRLPAVDLLPAMRSRAGGDTAPVIDAMIAAAGDLAWKQTYAEDDGFDRAYLDRYAWFDLAGPEGPYVADGIRVMFGYWGQGLCYPDHSHPPEEHYLVLAGSAWFRLGRLDWRRLGPGEVFHTPAGAVHSAEMRGEPLVAMSVWRAADLSVRVNLTDSGRDVVLPGECPLAPATRRPGPGRIRVPE